MKILKTRNALLKLLFSGLEGKNIFSLFKSSSKTLFKHSFILGKGGT
jgi:hypothetical protein